MTGTTTAVTKRSLTEDLRLLPSTDEIAKRIDEDAISIVEQIQEKLRDEVSASKDGRAFIEHPVPLLYEPRVKKTLKGWAKMQNYNLDYDRGKVKLAPRGIKFLEEKIELCSTCQNKHDARSFKVFKAFMVALATGIGSAMATGAYIFDKGWAWGVFGVIGVVGCICAGALMHADA